MDRKNIVFIGMPSSGKSTIGTLLARQTGMPFVDIDEAILKKVQKPLREVVIQDGLEKFLEIQEAVILHLQLEGTIIATGGSVVYSNVGMESLKQKGFVIFLKLPLSEIEKRLGKERRLARNNGQSFSDIYNERTILYEKYADIVIDCTGKSEAAIVDEIKRLGIM
jgi:shikimate kinase